MSSYSSSTQKKYWTFKDAEELSKYRLNANYKYINSLNNLSEHTPEKGFLTCEEEYIIIRHYEKKLRDFFQIFMPRNEQLPREVKGTSFHFFKRFFLVSSVMDFHPKEVILACVFLACKVCEYVVPIDMFVRCAQFEGNPRFLKSSIIHLESELLYRLSFKIHIHNPFQAIEGFMIDIRTRTQVQNPSRLNQHISRFLSSMWYTDVCLLYSPPLIALAAVTHAASRCNENIDAFVTGTLLCNPPRRVLEGIITTTRKIRSIVFNVKEPPTKEQISGIEEKLAGCCNPSNNPTSDEFKKKMMEIALESF